MRDGRTHLAERGHARDVGELGLGGLQRAPGPLLIVDVVSRPVPSDHLSVLIAQWHTAEKEPPIFTVSPTEAMLDFERLSCRQVSAPGGVQLREVIRMDRSPRGVLRATGIGSLSLIDVLGHAIAAISHHE